MGFFGFGKKKEKEKEQQAEQTVRAEEKPVEPAEQPEQEEKKQGLFSRLWQGLSKTRGNVAGRVDELIEATEKIEALTQQMLQQEPLPQTEDIMERTRHLNSLKLMAEETVLQSVVLIPR